MKNIKFKVGDLVRISDIGKQEYEDDETNPYDEVGRITRIVEGAGINDINVFVQWKECDNSYEYEELELVKGNYKGKYKLCTHVNDIKL